MCSADMCDLFLTVVRVAASFSFTINPPSTNFRIVCRRKDHGGSGGLTLVAVMLHILFVLVEEPPKVTVCSFILSWLFWTQILCRDDW